MEQTMTHKKKKVWPLAVAGAAVLAAAGVLLSAALYFLMPTITRLVGASAALAPLLVFLVLSAVVFRRRVRR